MVIDRGRKILYLFEGVFKDVLPFQKLCWQLTLTLTQFISDKSNRVTQVGLK